MTGAAQVDAARPAVREAVGRSTGFDVAIAVVLTVVAFVVRRHALPHDGLFYDDAVVGVGTHAPLSDLAVVGQDNPAFTLLLTVWRHVVPGSERLAIPALVAGTLSPAVLFGALRRFGYERAIAALLGAALVASGIDRIYSGRVKTYTIDVVIVIALLSVVPYLARVDWQWWTGVAWCVSATVLAPFSAFMILAAPIAGLFFVWVRRDEWRRRLPWVLVQLAASGAMFYASRRASNSAALGASWQKQWNAFIGFDHNPLHLAADIARHVRRLAEVYPGGPGISPWCWIVAAIAGIAIMACVRGKPAPALRARYVALVVGVAIVGSIADKVPFGPAKRGVQSPGGRVSMWLIPFVALGLAAFLQLVRRAVGGVRPARRVFDTAAFALAVVLLASAARSAVPAYPFPGSRTATRFVVAHSGPSVAVFIDATTAPSFALESGERIVIDRRPKSAIGYLPRVDDRRVHVLEGIPSPTEMTAALRGTRRVYLVVAEPGVASAESARASLTFVVSLQFFGYHLGETRRFAGGAVVRTWVRSAS